MEEVQEKPNYADDEKVENKLDKFVDTCFFSLYETWKKKVIKVKSISENEYNTNEEHWRA